MATRDEAIAAWQAHQEERRAQHEQDQAEARQREIDRALKVLERHGYQAGGGEDLETLRAEHEEYRQAVVSLEERLSGDHQAAELQRLQQGLRDRDARDKFFALARDAKANPRALDALWRLAEHKADSDEPDVRALQTTLERLRVEADYCFEQPASNAPAATPAARLEPTPAATNGNGAFVFDRGRWQTGT